MAEKFSASVAKRHMGCAGSANLELAIPNWVPPVEDRTADTAANRGTQMHSIFASAVGLGARDAANMAEALSYVASVRAGRRFKLLVEQSMQATWLQSEPWTTADLVMYVSDELHVFDFKTGRIPVDPFENEQLMYYAVTYGGLAPKASGAHLHIVQPSAGAMGSWFATAARLDGFKLDATRTEAAVLGGSTVLTPGDHCMFCPANPAGRGEKGRPFCPEMIRFLYPRTDVDEKEVLGIGD